MLDKQGRAIDYLRISVTDRCDLRCTYCMPAEGIPTVKHEDIISYEEILHIARLLTGLGIKKVRLTGGEPLVRCGLPSLIAGLKAINGIETVAMTTNGVLLSEQLPTLVAAGLDGVNISIDAIEEDVFSQITRRGGVNKVLGAIEDACAYPKLKVKLNCVPMAENLSQLVPMVRKFLSDGRLSLRFIELMPIGLGQTGIGIPEEDLQHLLTTEFGVLEPLAHNPTDGPCRYYKLGKLPGKIGFISALSHSFCDGCNRVRLTSGGFLKTCLQYDKGVALRPLLSGRDDEILSAMKHAIWDKPEHHRFTEQNIAHRERHMMSQIGG